MKVDQLEHENFWNFASLSPAKYPYPYERIEYTKAILYVYANYCCVIITGYKSIFYRAHFIFVSCNARNTHMHARTRNTHDTHCFIHTLFPNAYVYIYFCRPSFIFESFSGSLQCLSRHMR